MLAVFNVLSYTALSFPHILCVSNSTGCINDDQVSDPPGCVSNSTYFIYIYHVSEPAVVSNPTGCILDHVSDAISTGCVSDPTGCMSDHV